MRSKRTEERRCAIVVFLDYLCQLAADGRAPVNSKSNVQQHFRLKFSVARVDVHACVAQIVALADLHSVVAQNVVGGNNVKIEVR